ncbi:hypothetical protein FE257_003454 [Aspergillus nanangensis]|uniref:Uncharacterized protein n=1 Tax=Aspergillus nanangensis TaxID=2582783 RepID=A0AAD4CBL3_ASPNN|nr:hypothetical protein FE257_003454 [Aspergillus nanangensis]
MLGEDSARVTFVQCDLADVFSTRNTAEYIKRTTDRLDILICNAGIGISTEYIRSPQGIEAVFAANCVGHQVLTSLLLPLMKQTVSNSKSGNARVVVTSSSLHSFCRELNFDLLTSSTPPKHKHLNGIWRYARSKLGNILFTRELNRRLLQDGDAASSRIYANTFFPGNIVTDQWNAWNEYFGSFIGAVWRFLFHILGQSKEDGAATAMYLAASPAIVADNIRGQYFIPIATQDMPASIASDMGLARDTWDWIDAKVTETLGPNWQSQGINSGYLL